MRAHEGGREKYAIIIHCHSTLSELVELFKKRFADTENMRAFEELKRLYQTQTMKEYMQKFENMKQNLNLNYLT